VRWFLFGRRFLHRLLLLAGLHDPHDLRAHSARAIVSCIGSAYLAISSDLPGSMRSRIRAPGSSIRWRSAGVGSHSSPRETLTAVISSA